MSPTQLSIVFVALAILPLTPASAQLSGSRGAVGEGRDQTQKSSGLPPLDPEVAQGYITIEGQAELRVKPTEIRVVLAVTAEGKTPSECKRKVTETIKLLTAAWMEDGIAQQSIVEDFIAVLPRYDFDIEKIHDQDVAVEKKAGYLMQTNLHLAVKNDVEAMEAINLAFEKEVADIIAFDYWSKELDEMKIKARAAAVKAAQEKSATLLGTLFEQQPPLINLQESTRTFYPESMYESFTNSNDTQYELSYSRRDIPVLRTFRPKNTYYRGLYPDGDVQSKELPMQSEISIVSAVRLYFESPAAKERPTSTKREQ